VIIGVLIMTPLVNATLLSVALSMGAIIIGTLVVTVVFRNDDRLYESALRERLGSRVDELEQRVERRHQFTVQDSLTYRKIKLISEDYATGGLDIHKPGLLLEGLRFRYVIRPKDVRAVIEDKNHLLITFVIAGVPLTIVVAALEGDWEKERLVRDAIHNMLVGE
jgi:hypothetical protein